MMCFLSQVPLFEMDQDEDEKEDVLSMKSRGKEEDFECTGLFCRARPCVEQRKLIINSLVLSRTATETTC